MDKVISVILPLFAMILCGFVLVKLEIIAKETVKGLVGVVFYLFLPCFIFTKTLGAREHEMDWLLLAAYYSACALVFFLAAIGGRWLFGADGRTACLRGLAAISGVVGYMGLPLAMMAFGEKAILPALMITMADNLVILAGGALMMEMTEPSSEAKRPLTQVLLSISKGIISNPLILSVGLALLFLAAQWQLPSPLAIFATQMTNATGPLALVALGAALAVHANQGLASREALFLAFLKTLLLPLAVYISCHYLFDMGAFETKVAVLMASLPIAVNVFIMAARYKTYELTTSNAMMLSAVLGVFVLSLLMLILGE